MNRFRFRVGTTSYIYPADIITNARKLAGVIDDVEVVLFDAGDESNLPTSVTLREMKEIASANNMSYTIHLPLQLALGNPDSARRAASIDCAVKIIGLARQIEPWAHVVHLNALEQGDLRTAMEWLQWSRRCAESLSLVASRTTGTAPLCIENLDGYDIARLAPILDGLPIHLCLDIGHLWVQDADPVPRIERYAERIRVVHIHGVSTRDHVSLERVDAHELKRALDALVSNGFEGVLTIEVFRYRDLVSSLRCIEKWAAG